MYWENEVPSKTLLHKLNWLCCSFWKLWLISIQVTGYIYIYRLLKLTPWQQYHRHRVKAEPGITFRDELLMTSCRSRLNPWKSSESYFCSCCSGNSSYTGELCWHKNVRDDRIIFWITCSSEHKKRKTLHQKYFEGVSFKHS